MAIEKSIFDHDKMQMLLLQEYGFHLIENQHLPLGTANCYKISCEEGAYFFKEYQKEFTIQDVKREAELVEYLNSKDFPAARFIKTINGNSCILFEGHVISVQEYLEGKSYLKTAFFEIINMHL